MGIMIWNINSWIVRFILNVVLVLGIELSEFMVFD